MTNRVLTLWLFLVISSSILSAFAAGTNEVDAASAALKQMCKVAKDSPADIGQHIIAFKMPEGVSAAEWKDYVTARHERLGKILSEVIAAAPVQAVKVQDNVACLACIESPGDLDPILLVRRDGKWLLSPRITKLKPEQMEVTEKEVKAAGTLLEWFDTYSDAYQWPDDE